MTDKGILQTFIERQAPHFQIDDLEKRVKPVFVKKIKAYLAQTPVLEIKGAKAFIEKLKSNDQIMLSFATGGWKESAIAKLESAGFDISGIAMVSSNDHYSREVIMQMARAKVEGNKSYPITYFGDAQWDVNTCQALEVNLVIVGNRVAYKQSIEDFTFVDKAMRFVELLK